jgi:Trk-type K+ transport system membrane component
LAIGFAVFLLSLFDPKVDVLKLAFETFSAFCTVGLTLGITPQLSDASKVVLIIMMFLGRVSLLTFIIAIMRQFYEPRGARYQYPKEDIFIN